MKENTRYRFVGYTVANGLPHITKAQAMKLTHLNIAFGVVEDDLISIERIRKFFRFVPMLRKYNPNLNILLSTGGGNAFGHGPATKPDKIEAFVDSTMAVVREFDLDGIDCDWEFPGNTGDADEKYQHVDLMQRYRAELDKYAEERGRKCVLSIAAAAGQWFLDTTCMEQVHPYLDFINLMTYDLRGWNQPAGHHTNLFEPVGAPVEFSVDTGIKLLLGIGVPADKLVVGCAFYSRRWDGVKPQPEGEEDLHGMHQWAETIGDFGPDYTQIRLNYEANPQFTKYWDDVAKAPWLWDGYSFISYDDPQSIACKAAYVKENGLGGLMYWQHTADATGTLFDAMYDNLMLGED